MSRTKLVAALVILGAATLVAMGSIYTVSEVEQAIITQFGKPVGAPVTAAGLKIKLPFIQEVNLVDKRVLEWDGSPTDMPTKDKLYVSVDLFARWRIADPLQYFLRLHDERSAQSRLDDILGSETRNAVAKHELIEIIRTTKDRVPLRDTLLAGAGPERDMGSLVPIQKGRKTVEQEIFAEAAENIVEAGLGAALIVQPQKILEGIYNPPAGEKVDRDVEFLSLVGISDCRPTRELSCRSG